ncbi:LexA family transcriptional regulator [Avibacterium paragallinarum]|uniref:Transcriptional regulator n=1 Tax=Avibacterium paragallinarum TaxID=728 RepID=A0AAE5TII8_AVIPA|nr:helix-turn-helix transcriptional regulator [Avibacterium paragallinarum]MEE3607530.1 helix-turn-helix transcriptional regulator [Avibacterium paragallinarum]MEE3620094.1 helix-turn-helix transcriptional regulator [Avibacterium paragallinarum]MEE3667778.1 helix-turn-helix transcriptional regulator [Avibacterium paragallinarum]MEE3680006.1 helix-turn-helix transcriptional regulator [Avibacterium paragallinarum]MEE4384911.1 helix-turn-helix transcriptional regulator [Avibacterium paragallinaru
MSKPNIYDEKFSERMKSIANTNFKGNYSEFARAVGVAQASLARWVKGEADPSRSNLVKIAEVTNVSLEWLATGKEPNKKGIVSKAFEYLEKEFAEFDGIAMLRTFESIEVSAGFGSFNEGVTQPDGQIPYDNNLLQRLGVKPQHCGVFWANGYSMQPTIFDGDQLLVDFSKKEIKNEKIYLVQNGESIWVKRIKLLWNGVELISDNKEEYPPFKITAEEAQDIQIIGQVVHIGHSLV